MLAEQAHARSLGWGGRRRRHALTQQIPAPPADTLISLPQSLLLHAGIATEDPDYGEAFRWVQWPGQPPPGSETRAGRALLFSSPSHVNPLPRHRQLQQESKDLDQRYVLCLLLILERAKQERSTWSLYLGILPSSYGNTAAGPRTSPSSPAPSLTACLCVTALCV
jgi:hypothetical protein